MKSLIKLKKYIKKKKKDEDQKAFTDDELLEMFFDEDYYLETNQDVLEAAIDPLTHYKNFGWKEGRNPSRSFNTIDYLRANQDIDEADIEPFLHYLKYGKFEGRKLPSPKLPKKRFASAYATLNNTHSGNSRAPEYAPNLSIPVIKNEGAPKTIAFYLPQFHPFQENDKWWGKGFTEWTNVAKTIPQFEGHYQPRLPSDLGYYDLRLPEVMKEQAKMAVEHGINGFCFHYYWFAGHRLMDRPIEQYLESREDINFPFCLCWANENWTRRWDGSENDILIKQEHSEKDNEAIFFDLLRYFRDKRYICVNGKPLLVIYRPDIIPNIKGLTEQFRSLAIEEGLPGIHLVATNSFGFSKHIELGFDALVEFPPHNVVAGSISSDQVLFNDNFSGKIFEYMDVVHYSLDRLKSLDKQLATTYYPTVMTSWDNSARKPGKGHIFHNAVPSKFQYWFEGAYRWSQKSHSRESNFVFVNAWNEWAEGTYLEPDKKYGYAYLNSIRSSINEALTEPKELKKLADNVKGKKQSDIVVIAHVFYEDLIDEICDKIILAKKYEELDIAVSIPDSFSIKSAEILIERLKPVKLIVSENRGRDIWPFLQTLVKVKDLNYKYGCKIHSKKSTHIDKGNLWRISIYDALLSESALTSFKEICLKSNNAGLISPNDFMMKLEGDSLVDNKKNLDLLLQTYQINPDKYSPFIAGTMFWFGFDWANQLDSELINSDFFGCELGAIDGTIAHAFERLFTTHAVSLGYEVINYETDKVFTPYNSN